MRRRAWLVAVFALLVSVGWGLTPSAVVAAGPGPVQVGQTANALCSTYDGAADGGWTYVLNVGSRPVTVVDPFTGKVAGEGNFTCATGAIGCSDLLMEVALEYWDIDHWATYSYQEYFSSGAGYYQFYTAESGYYRAWRTCTWFPGLSPNNGLHCTPSWSGQ